MPRTMETAWKSIGRLRSDSLTVFSLLPFWPASIVHPTAFVGATFPSLPLALLFSFLPSCTTPAAQERSRLYPPQSTESTSTTWL